MNGASLLPRMSPWLWFSMTMVNTLPCHWGEGCVSGDEIASHVVAVLPDVFAQPARAAATTNGASVSILRMCAKDDGLGAARNGGRGLARYSGQRLSTSACRRRLNAPTQS